MIIKKRNFSKEVMNKPVSDVNVYYTKGDGKIRKIKLKTLIKKLNKISYTRRWYQTIRQAQKDLERIK
ncbi:hypothetical protein [Hyphomonas sp.]|uniref:hypothetical protein n=1 Tax=Hyphomonas sp. TaxID=87 RepID=UPI0025C5B15C|nr:hypothetical protein [Hyphomonas sp.]|tara:strand:+ start:6536 stop:6739 length:204 start_codon:yes stop_codon:yes gene_type:complete